MMTIGEKIKKIRMERGITQEALGRGCVTKTMISAIECGKVGASIETLLVIAERLKTPVSYFLGETDDPFPAMKEAAAVRIRELFAKGNYAFCEKKLDALPGDDDETAYLRAYCAFYLGIDEVRSGALLSAAKHLQKALDYAKKTSFDTKRIAYIAPAFLAVAENVQAPLMNFDADAYTLSIADLCYEEFAFYLMQKQDYPFTNPAMKKHMEAKTMMKANRYQDAYRSLSALADEIRGEDYHAFIMYSIYTDLELCAKQLGDYETAYRCSSKRMSLLEGFKS